MYHGDIRLGDTIDIKFTTVNTLGVPTTLAGSPVVSAYFGNDVAQLTAGITLTPDFDGVVGLHNIRVVATGGNGYATTTNYALVITTGTVGGSSVVGYVVGSFSIQARQVTVATLLAAAANMLADHILRRTYANARASADGDALAFRSLLGAEAKLVNLTQVNGANLEITHEDDATVFGTQAITTTPGANPITKLDTV